MINLRKTGNVLGLLILIVAMISACKSEDIVPPVPEEPKPSADFTYEQVEKNDPFTFLFENNSADFKEVRWEFGDDSSSLEVSPEHTFLRTGTFRVKLRAQNSEGYWAQKEMVIDIFPEDITEIVAAPAGNASLNLSAKSPFAIDSVFWYKGIGPGAEFITGNTVANVLLEKEQFENYTLRIKTPKGSMAEVSSLLTDVGVVQDVTNGATLTVSKENGSPDANEGSLKLVDNSHDTKFLLPDMHGMWLKMEYFKPQIVNAYSFTSANDADQRDPKKWNLEGSHDGENWVRLDERSEEKFDKRFLTKNYLFENSTAYTFYRVNILEVESGGVFQMAEWRLLQMPQRK